MYELLKQKVPWLYCNRNCIAAAWGCHCSSSGKQSTTIADGIGHVFADLLSINLRGYDLMKIKEWCETAQCHLIFDEMGHCIC